MAQNIIELNGKKYDAISGMLLGESRIKATALSRATHSHQAHQGRVIDGFMRSEPQHLKPTDRKPAAPKTDSKPKKAAPHKGGQHFDIRRGAKSNIQPHPIERPKTLMRHVVKKPDVTMKPAIKTMPPSEVAARPTSTIAKPLEKKLSVSQVDPIRLARSHHIAQSQHIRRFEKQSAQPGVTAASVATNPIASARVSRPVPQTPYVRRPGDQMVRTAPVRSVAAAGRPAAPAQPVTQSASDVFEAALAHATSHEEQVPRQAKYRSSKHRRWVNIMAGIGTFLLIAGFTASMNMRNIELRVASMRAGFHAQLPGYQPNGYALDGNIESQEGKVAMNFRSGNSLYTVTQEASDWNSVTLLDQALSTQGKPAKTIQSKGRTIYIYSGANAAWVNGGVRYQVTGNAPLDTDELVSLATSM